VCMALLSSPASVANLPSGGQRVFPENQDANLLDPTLSGNRIENLVESPFSARFLCLQSVSGIDVDFLLGAAAQRRISESWTRTAWIETD